MPCLPENVDIDKFNGVPCWNIGWGTDELGNSYSRRMKSIGLNLMSQNYCTAHSFWEVEDGYLCGGLPPNDKTPTMGWKHVTAGGKEACHGDYGAPLVCNIDGEATLIGVNSLGDLKECGLDGKPAIHVNVKFITHWINHVIDKFGPPKLHFEFIVDMNVPGALGDTVYIFQNGNPVTVNGLSNNPIVNALDAQQTSHSFWIWQAYDGDEFKFVNGGSDGVSFTNT